MIRLGIGIPAYTGQLDMGHAAMWLGLGAALADTRDKIELCSMIEYQINGIDLCRNTIVYDALTARCDWVLMVDADTFHRSTDFNGTCEAVADAGVDLIQMIRDADRGRFVTGFDAIGKPVLLDIPLLDRSNGVGLVGAPVRGRGFGNNGYCVRVFEELTEASRSVKTRPTTVAEIRARVQPVARIGAACIAVNCNWLRAYWPTGPWFEMHHDYSARPVNARGEDYNICDGIWQRGGAVLCDGRFEPKHVARRKLVGED